MAVGEDVNAVTLRANTELVARRGQRVVNRTRVQVFSDSAIAYHGLYGSAGNHSRPRFFALHAEIEP